MKRYIRSDSSPSGRAHKFRYVEQFNKEIRQHFPWLRSIIVDVHESDDGDGIQVETYDGTIYEYDDDTYRNVRELVYEIQLDNLTPDAYDNLLSAGSYVLHWFIAYDLGRGALASDFLADIVDTYTTSSDEYLLELVAEHPNTPVESLRKLSQCNYSAPRSEARRALKARGQYSESGIDPKNFGVHSQKIARYLDDNGWKSYNDLLGDVGDMLWGYNEFSGLSASQKKQKCIKKAMGLLDNPNMSDPAVEQDVYDLASKLYGGVIEYNDPELIYE